MKNGPPLESAEAIALRRYALVTELKNWVDQGLSLAAALTAVVQKAELDPEKRVAVRTLEDWWYAYRRGGFAALKPKARADRGQSRTLTVEQRQRILDAIRRQPAIPIKVHYRHWKRDDPSLPSLSSVHRFLWQQELNHHQRRALVRQALSGPTKAWETAAVNELWMVDFSPGPWVQRPAEPKALATQLCVMLDDHSRVVTAARYQESADTRAFHAVFKEALRRRGVPRAVYADHGGPFVNDHTRVVCAQLGIRLLHARPYHAWSKGKIERFFHTLQSDFEAALQLPGQAPVSLDELNQRLAEWLATYHTRVHATTGQTPEQRFAAQAHRVHALDPGLDLDRVFYAQQLRLVRKDGTLRLDNDWYEVPLCLRGLEVRLRFDPWTRERIEIDYRGQSFGVARKLNRQINGQAHLPGL